MIYRYLVRPLLFLLPPETAHTVAFGLWRGLCCLPLISHYIRARLTVSETSLACKAFGRSFPSPVGLAAGFDKDGVGINALAAMGFSFVEVGTVTPRPQRGQQAPRLFRLPKDRALINRMGFNNAGCAAMIRRLRKRRDCIVGVNIGKNADTPLQDAVADYTQCAAELAPYADYLAINISSPNTEGLRELQRADGLNTLLEQVKTTAEAAAGRPVPVLVKIAPDLSNDEIRHIVRVVLTCGLDGIIATNTTVKREGLRTAVARTEAIGSGGLSGAPLKDRSLQVLREIRRTAGNQLIVISVGGIENGRDVIERLEAGATLVQLYTAVVYKGPSVVRAIHNELGALRRLSTY